MSEKTTQLSRKKTTQLSVGTKQLNSSVGTKQLKLNAYNRLQPPATANRLHPPTTAYNRLQPPTTACNRLQPPATACNRRNRLQPPATACTACTAFTAESALLFPSAPRRTIFFSLSDSYELTCRRIYAVAALSSANPTATCTSSFGEAILKREC
ncbi:hypothetical protein TNCV_123291 [Trichonephila clavipes]|nr:hypothetical protein TNCV_123291 [Trichonephila clavipes]